LTFDEAKIEHEALMKRYGNGITTGYNVLDSYFKFLPQQLYILSAPTHVGKTTLAINLCGRIARAGYKVLYASLEQGVFIVPRIIDIFKSDKGLENLSMVAPDFMPTTEDFIDLIEKDPNKATILVVDHLHYFDRGSKSAAEEVDRLVVRMQMLAKKLEIPVLVIAHVRKLNYQKPKPGKDGIIQEPAPTMDDLKDSSSLSQVPSVVMMMQRKRNPEEEIRMGSPVYSDEGILYVYKNRIHGITGSENFKIYDNGEIVFARDFNDRIATDALPTPYLFYESSHKEEEKEADVFDELGI
jgi:replicative DNA helicase